MPSLRISALFLAVMLITGQSGCGKTGPLYLPDKQAGIEQSRHTLHLTMLSA